jgi:hypothetical protein
MLGEVDTGRFCRSRSVLPDLRSFRSNGIVQTAPEQSNFPFCRIVPPKSRSGTGTTFLPLAVAARGCIRIQLAEPPGGPVPALSGECRTRGFCPSSRCEPCCVGSTLRGLGQGSARPEVGSRTQLSIVQGAPCQAAHPRPAAPPGLTKFVVGPTGNTYTLDSSGNLDINGAPWEGNTRDFALDSQGTVYWLGNSASNFLLQKQIPGGWLNLDSGVQSIGRADDGNVYYL